MPILNQYQSHQLPRNMSVSLSYRVTLFALRAKGIKKMFSQDPIPYQKLRKDDVLQPKPSFFKGYQVKTFTIAESTLTEVKPQTPSDRLVVFIHGGAFISGPAQHHWDAVKTLVKETGHTVWLCDYPKAPETQIKAISENINAVYNAVLENYPGKQAILIGDSVGGNLITGLTQRLIRAGKPLPRKVILISPVMDSTFSNPQIPALDKRDPMLSLVGLKSSKRMCAGEVALDDPMMSPLYGSFEGFPETVLFLGDRDICYADEQLAVAKMKKAGVKLKVIEGKKMPHIWPILPVMKEGKEAFAEIISQIIEA